MSVDTTNETSSELKIQLTKRSVTALLLLNPRSRNMGTNEAEEYAAHDIAKGKGDERG